MWVASDVGHDLLNATPSVPKKNVELAIQKNMSRAYFGWPPYCHFSQFCARVI